MTIEKQKLVKQVEKIIRKAVAFMRKVWNSMLWVPVLTGGILAWAGRDAIGPYIRDVKTTISPVVAVLGTR